jgi:hypothetical protein
MTMANNHDYLRRFFATMAKLIGGIGIEREKNNPIVVADMHDINWAVCESLVAHRCGDVSAGTVLCKYNREEDMQAAFNCVVDALPGDMELEARWWKPGSRINITIIPPGDTNKSDPLGQSGFVGMRWSPKP